MRCVLGQRQSPPGETALGEITPPVLHIHPQDRCCRQDEPSIQVKDLPTAEVGSTPRTDLADTRSDCAAYWECFTTMTEAELVAISSSKHKYLYLIADTRNKCLLCEWKIYTPQWTVPPSRSVPARCCSWCTKGIFTADLCLHTSQLSRELLVPQCAFPSLISLRPPRSRCKLSQFSQWVCFSQPALWHWNPQVLTAHPLQASLQPCIFGVLLTLQSSPYSKPAGPTWISFTCQVLQVSCLHPLLTFSTLSPAHSSQRATSSARLKNICMLSAIGLPLPSPLPVTLGLGFPPQKSLHVLRVDFPITPLHWGQLLGCQHTRAVYACWVPELTFDS